MPTYTVRAAVTISVWTDVDAASEQEAIEIAQDRSMQRLCHQCSDGRGAKTMWRTFGELDGKPHDLTAEVE